MAFDPNLERYSRQMRFSGIREAGQKKLLTARVTLCGCGALGTVLANHLVRSGVGNVRIVDRDFIETHNLQRQVLFDESDVASNIPKAEAAARKLRQVNSAVNIESVVTDINRTNILELCQDADLILDGTDNFEIRYLINDVAVKLNKPWVYGGAIGAEGMTMTIIPGVTPCLRCVFEAAPNPGEAGTCETAGVLSPTIGIVASFQAAEALKILTGQLDKTNRELLCLDIWDNTTRRTKIAKLLGKVDCPCCQRKKFEWLDGAMGSQTTSLCGRNAVQVATNSSHRLNFDDMSKQLSLMGGKVNFNRFMLKFDVEEFEFTVFPDGRAIIKGTNDIEKARVLYAKYIGH
jgi:molybdopterin/thiamine biosynthesis adenylyltransferase